MAKLFHILLVCRSWSRHAREYEDTLLKAGLEFYEDPEWNEFHTKNTLSSYPFSPQRKVFLKEAKENLECYHDCF